MKTDTLNEDGKRKAEAYMAWTKSIYGGECARQEAFHATGEPEFAAFLAGWKAAAGARDEEVEVKRSVDAGLITRTTVRKVPAYDVMKARSYVQKHFGGHKREIQMEELGKLVDFILWEQVEDGLVDE